MKGYKTIVILAVIVVLISSTVFADESSLTKAQAIEKAIMNSVQILTQTNNIKQLERDYADSVRNARSMGELLSMEERRTELEGLDNLMPEEAMELSVLKNILGNRMTEDEKFDIEISSKLTEDNLSYVIDMNKASLEGMKNSIALNMNDLYNSLARVDGTIKVKKLLINNLESNYSKSNIKYRLGKISNNDLKKLKNKLDIEKLMLNKLLYQRKIMINNIQKAIGEDQNKPYKEYVIEEMKEIDMKPLEEYIKHASEKRNDIISANKLYKMKQKEYEITKAYYPFEHELKHQEAFISMDEAKNNLDGLNIDVRIEVNNAYNELQKRVNVMKAADNTFQVNTAKYKEAQKKYSQGMITELEVSNANIDYIDSNIRYINAKRDAWQGKLNLDYICAMN